MSLGRMTGTEALHVMMREVSGAEHLHEVCSVIKELAWWHADGHVADR